MDRTHVPADDRAVRSDFRVMTSPVRVKNLTIAGVNNCIETDRVGGA